MNKSQNGPLWLESHGLVVGILPDVGGRIVHFGTDRNTNILKSDSGLWNEPDSLRPVIAADGGWKEYNGHIVWLGPQTEWWTRQELNPGRKEEKAMWPPDPWIIYGNYEVTAQSDSSLRMTGPHSPVSGVTLYKEIRITEGPVLTFHVRAKNTSEEPVEWDLWLNTRMDAFDRVYVPVASASHVEIDSESTSERDTVNYMIEEGYFSYLPTEISGGKKRAFSKAFITPSKPWMAAFCQGYCFVIGFDLYDPAKTHQDQAMVEIYNRQSLDEAEGLTELEYHGPFERIEPGEEIEVSSTWRIFPFSGTESDRPGFLNGTLKTVSGRE